MSHKQTPTTCPPTPTPLDARAELHHQDITKTNYAAKFTKREISQRTGQVYLVFGRSMPQEIALVYLKFSGCGVDICLPSRQVFFENPC